MKKTRLLTLIMAVLLMICMIPASAFADDYDVYQYTTTLKSYSDLGQDGGKLLKDYGTIIISGAIETNSLADLANLTNPYTEDPYIPLIDGNYAKQWPIKVLPEYDPSTGTFKICQAVKVSNGHVFPQDYQWAKTLTYVYALDGNNTKTAVIDHGVVDETGRKMLQYGYDVSKSGETKPRVMFEASATDKANNTITVTLTPDNITAPSYSHIGYDDVIHGYTNRHGFGASTWAKSKSYGYTVKPQYLSTVKLNAATQVLGGIKIVKESKYGLSLEGAVFNLYTNQGCTAAAKAFNAATQTWETVGDLTTGKDGSVVVKNLAAGTYYAKEKTAPEGYVLNSTPVKLVVADSTPSLALDTTSGEGNSSKTIDANASKLNPEWEAYGVISNNTQTLDMGVAPLDGGSAPSVSPSDFDGGQVFIKAGGKAVAITGLSSLDSYTKLSTDKYVVKVYGKSAPNKSVDTLKDALAYVNDTLITGKKIDDATEGRNHVTITTASGKTVYYAKASETFTEGQNQATVTNEAIPVDITVNKSWFNKTEPQPGEVVTVQLYQDGEKLGDAVKLDSKNKWTYTWKELEGGHEYDVKEASMPDNCILVGIEREGNIFTITNKIVKDVQVTKSWFNDTPALRGETLEVQLYKDGKEYGESVILTAENDWTYVWENVEAKGKYTVKEVKVPRGYKASYESEYGDDIDLLLIKNTFVKESPKTGDDTLLIACSAVAVTAALVYVALKLRKEQ